MNLGIYYNHLQCMNCTKSLKTDLDLLLPTALVGIVFIYN